MAAFALALAVPAYAQVAGGGLDGGVFDVGLGIRFVERDISPEDATRLGSADFHVTGAYARYGVTPWLTLSVEAATANTHALEIPLHETNIDGRYVVAGVGVLGVLREVGNWRIGAGLHVTRLGFVSRDEGSCNERETEWLATLHAERAMRWGRQRFTIWGGPAYNVYRVQFLGADCSGTKWESTDNWGAIAGIDALWFERVNTFVHASIVQHVQPRVGIALRFR